MTAFIMPGVSDAPVWLRAEGQACMLDVHVVPNARHTQLDGEHGGALRVRLGAPAVDGKANAALLVYLATCCDVPRRAIMLIAAPVDAVWLRLSALLQQPG